MHEDQGDDSARHTEQLSALTLLMYQAAQDPERWAEMSALLRDAAIPFEDDRLYQQPTRRRRMLDALIPHVEQALRLGEQMERTRETRDLAVATLERLPIGIAVVDAQLNIITLNRIAAGALSDSEVLSNHQGRLRINNRRQHQALHQALARCLEQGSHHALPLTEPATGVTVSLLVCPSRTVDMEDPERPAATLFISHSNLDNLVDEALLGDLYDLTPAESKVAKGLVSGHTLDRIAEDAQVAPATVRAQLKSVFRKTDTGRQAELVSVILSGLAPLAPGPAERTPPAQPEASLDPPALESFESGKLTAGDGRTLRFHQYGNADGTPVIFFHSVRGSRLEVPGGADILHQLNLRLIVPDRPGYGLSDPLKDRDIDDLVADLERLTEHLGIHRFHLLGYSLGGFLALHCASRLGDRVQRLGLVSALGPTHLSGDADPMRGLFRMVVGVADRAPDLMENVLNLVARGLIKNPDKHLRRFVTFTSPADAPVFAQQCHRDAYVKAVKEAYRNGCQGFVEDLRTVARAPEPAAASLTMPVFLWHGERDGQVPVAQALAVDQWLPNSRLTLEPDGGHFFVYDRWRDILTRFTEPA
ncbi:MAG: pimeloyl-ACP methyl ester carboxylesterase/DNA-binding CsgD family transcriptional regulator [Alloalcanivorax sp.]|jgi:pimeloyl-ACP methyl ester carboxylesterase/DNA-binding CsgD family transcriptional regulator